MTFFSGFSGKAFAATITRMTFLRVYFQIMLFQIFHGAEISLGINGVDARLHRAIIACVFLRDFIQLSVLVHLEIVQSVTRFVPEDESALFALDIVVYYAQLFRQWTDYFLGRRATVLR